jgi:hypothetical protein
VVVAAAQAGDGSMIGLLAVSGPMPAQPPIGGPFWTWVVPVLLFLTAFVATWMLYRHFAKDAKG